MTDNVNILSLYEPNIDKSILKEKIAEAMILYEKASSVDKEKMARKLIAYSKTLEEGLKIGFSGMTELYDEKCDADQYIKELEAENVKLKEFIYQECTSNPQMLEEFNKINNTIITRKKGKHDYNDMINKYILKAKDLKK